MTRRVCSVPDCSSIVDCKLFTFPSRTNLQCLWLAAIQNPELSSKSAAALSAYRVCSKHFPTSDFQTPERKKLNRNVVPSLFLTHAEEVNHHLEEQDVQQQYEEEHIGM